MFFHGSTIGRKMQKATRIPSSTLAPVIFIALDIESQLAKRRQHRLDADGVHAARVRALGAAALAAAHPCDIALEQRALVAAREVGNRDLSERRLAPEAAAAEQHVGARSVERDGRRLGQLRYVRD